MKSEALPKCAFGAVESSVLSTDSGNLYVFFANGGIGYIRADDPGSKTTIALATAAILAQKDVSVRYANGTACHAQFALIDGFGMAR